MKRTVSHTHNSGTITASAVMTIVNVENSNQISPGESAGIPYSNAVNIAPLLYKLAQARGADLRVCHVLSAHTQHASKHGARRQSAMTKKPFHRGQNTRLAGRRG